MYWKRQSTVVNWYPLDATKLRRFCKTFEGHCLYRFHSLHGTSNFCRCCYARDGFGKQRTVGQRRSCRGSVDDNIIKVIDNLGGKIKASDFTIIDGDFWHDLMVGLACNFGKCPKTYNRFVVRMGVVFIVKVTPSVFLSSLSTPDYANASSRTNLGQGTMDSSTGLA